MSGKNNEDEASFVDDDSEDEDISSGEEEEEVIAETQPPQQPILASHITEGARYQFQSTPERLNASHRVQQQFPIVDAARCRVSNSTAGSVGATATITSRIGGGGSTTATTVMR
jgi:hypothetical protein